MKPSPPKIIFANRMAKTAPSPAAHGGTNGGRVMASRSPVQTALPVHVLRVGQCRRAVEEPPAGGGELDDSRLHQALDRVEGSLVEQFEMRRLTGAIDVPA